MALDVTQAERMTSGASPVAESLGGLAVGVNVAGVDLRQGRLHEYSDREPERVLGVNLTGPFRCLRAEIVATMAGHGGSMVTVSASVGFAGAAGYSTPKHRSDRPRSDSSLEYAEDQDRINAVTPAFVETELLSSRSSRTEIGTLTEAHPLGWLFTPDELPAVVSFLAPPRASAVTGSATE